jgi:hypothetical protein
MASVAGRLPAAAMGVTLPPRLEVIEGGPPRAPEGARRDLDSGSYLAPSEPEAAPSGPLRPDQAPSATPPLYAAALRQAAENLLALAGAMDGGEAPPPPRVELPPERWLDTAVAAKISGRSYATLYRWALKFGVGEQLASGAWHFSERRLRRFLASEAQLGEVGDFGDAAALPLAK